MLDPLQQLLQPSGEKSQGANRSANLFNRIQPHMSAQSPFLPSSGSDFCVKKMFEIEVWTQLVEKIMHKSNWIISHGGLGVKSQKKENQRLRCYSPWNSLSSAFVAWGKKDDFLFISGVAGANLPPWSKDDVKLSLLWAFHVEAWFRCGKVVVFGKRFLWRFLWRRWDAIMDVFFLGGGGVYCFFLLKTGCRIYQEKNN